MCRGRLIKEPHLYQRRLTTLRVSNEAEKEEP